MLEVVVTKTAQQFIFLSRIIHILRKKRKENIFNSSSKLRKVFLLFYRQFSLSSSEAAAVIRNRGVNAGFFADYILI